MDGLLDAEDDVFITAAPANGGKGHQRAVEEDLKPTKDDVDAITAERLHSVKRICVISPDGKLRLWYNTSTLIRVAQTKGQWLQPPHFRETMKKDMIQQIEAVEGRKINVDIPILRKIGESDSEVQHAGHAGLEVDQHFLLSKKEIYVCPLCFDAAKRRLEDNIHQEMADMRDAIAAASAAGELGNADVQHVNDQLKIQERYGSFRRCPIEVLWHLDRRNELPYVAFAKAMTWKAHFKNVHGSSDDSAEDFKLRAFINTHLTQHNQKNFEKREFHKSHETTQKYWNSHARYNVMRYNHLREELDTTEATDLKTKAAFEVNVEYESAEDEPFVDDDDSDDESSLPPAMGQGESDSGDESSSGSSHGDLIKHLERAERRRKERKRARKEKDGHNELDVPARKSHRREATPAESSASDDDVDAATQDRSTSGSERDTSSTDDDDSDPSSLQSAGPKHLGRDTNLARLTAYERRVQALINNDEELRSHETKLPNRPMRQTTLAFKNGSSSRSYQATHVDDGAGDEAEEKEDFEPSLTYSKEVLDKIAQREEAARRRLRADAGDEPRSGAKAQAASQPTPKRGNRKIKRESSSDDSAILKGSSSNPPVSQSRPTLLIDDE
jgi:hypothetical protein